jgi:hypothetical protein
MLRVYGPPSPAAFFILPDSLLVLIDKVGFFIERITKTN